MAGYLYVAEKLNDQLTFGTNLPGKRKTFGHQCLSINDVKVYAGLQVVLLFPTVFTSLHFGRKTLLFLLFAQNAKFVVVFSKR